MRPRARPTTLVVATALIAFVAVLSFRSRPADPANRLPGRYRLADLIVARQRSAGELRAEVARLRAEVAQARAASVAVSGEAAGVEERLAAVGTLAGLSAMRGPGLEVTLDDSSLEEPPSGASVNDLVVHSEDVQAVVNALWRAGAEAIAINGQRLVATSAVLCVGNTLLLNGTVHSPPYVAAAIGASRDRFDADPLVRRLRAAAEEFRRPFSVARVSELSVPGYAGSTKLAFAKPA